jgi:hypothetical protein
MSEIHVPQETPVEIEEPEKPGTPEIEDENYTGPDPEADPKGDSSDEDQGVAA